MAKNSETTLSRREFLQKAAIIAGAISMTGASAISCSDSKSKFAQDGVPRLNAAFRIKEVSDNEIELFTHMQDGNVLKHTFEGFEADLFREINEEKELQGIIASLQQKHQLSEKKCRVLVEKSLDEFQEAKLIYFGDKMLVKLVEMKYE